MSSLVLGIGVGSFILFSTWIVTFILCLIAIRTKKIVGSIALLVATFITILLLAIPKRSESEIDSPEEKENDYNFVWHNLLATILGLCCAGSIVLFITEYAIEPIKPSLVRSWITE